MPSLLSLQQADGEELHQLAGVILVGDRAGRRVRLPVAGEGQIIAHRRRWSRSLCSKVAEIAERIVEQHVDIGGDRELPPGQVDAVDADDEEIEQRHADALAQLVGAGDQLAPHDRIEALLVVHASRRSHSRPGPASPSA